VNHWIALLVLIIAIVLEWHGYHEGKRKGFEQGFRRGYADGTLWWLRSEIDINEVRHEMWKEKT